MTIRLANIIFCVHVLLSSIPLLHAESADQPLRNSYVRLELRQTFPEATSAAHFRRGPVEKGFTYLHLLMDDWLVGIGGHITSMTPDVPPGKLVEAKTSQLAIWTLTHETLYTMRLYYPVYLLAGPKLYYLIPGKTGKLPIRRSSTLETEVGGGISLQLTWFSPPGHFLAFGVERWRGTKTSRLHGTDIVISGGLALD